MCRLMFVDVVYCSIYILTLPKLAYAEMAQGRSLYTGLYLSGVSQ